jgi:hypothetical protein
VATANERILDAEIGHQVDLQRYSNGVVRRILGLLNRTDADLFAQLTAALARMTPETFTVQRLEELLGSVRALNLQVHQQLDRALTEELRALAEHEAGFQLRLFEAVIPPQVQVHVAVTPVVAEQVYAAAFSQPFQGRLLREWAGSLEAGKLARIRDAVRMGYVEQQTVDQIVQRVRGTWARGYQDGVIEISRRDAESVVRTSISHIAGFTRDRFYSANDDLVQAVQWVSTLDGRTSEGCRLRDGLKYTATNPHRPIGHKVPWLGGPGRLHWNCRSTSAPVLKSWRELGIPMDGLDAGTRSSMDGQVPADMTYGQWLQRQSAARQDDVLGPTRGALFRRGGLPLERFSNDRGRYLTLAELAQREAQAFRAAGVPLAA